MQKIVIGVCSVGSGVGQSVVDSCSFFREKVTLIGLGNNPLAYGAFDCDDYALIPSYYDSDYITQLKNCIQYYGIQVLIPGHDDEALLLARYHKTLSSLGTKLIVSPHELISKCRSKSTYINSFHEAAKYFVKSYHPDEINDQDLPLIRKPEQGFASNGISIINTRKKLDACKHESGYIYQEIASPRKIDPSYTTFSKKLATGGNLQVSEISLQLILNKDSTVVESCATYNSLKDGIPIEIKPYPLCELAEFIKNIALSLKRLNAFGPINIQGRMTDNGFKVFEINPRFTGITGLRAKLGFNEVEYCVFNLIYNQYTKSLSLADGYIGIRQVASKKVQKARVKPIVKEDVLQKRILLTGSSGMIGSRLFEQLSSQGHNIAKLYTQEKKTNDKNAYSLGDLNSGTINLSNFDTIIHLGFARPNSNDNEIHSSLVNSFELITQTIQSSVDQFIFVSSQSVYGFSENETFTEECETNPQSSYARAKVTVENHIKSLTKLSNETRFTVLRLASVIAPIESNLAHEAYSSMTADLLQNKTITLNTPNRLISKIDINDALDAIAHFVNYTSNHAYEIVNIGPAKTYSLLDTIKTIATELGKPEKSIHIDSTEDSAINNLVVSAEKAKKEYGWEAKTSITETANYFKDYLGY
ncbi:NAD-dependent epimerase/dehydratase family protein [Vreelandella sulfidaeris]|uniref:NAD-dependent epimerase/dehydratase family protein n=1 Tax=Vreelandella sulfidaeris TaxID=115553 RepID=UPI0035E5B6DA